MILVHKASRGILERVPSSLTSYIFQGKRIPKLNRITEENICLLDINPDEWWVVDEKAQSSLAYKLKLYYPFFDPIEADGKLVDIKKWEKWKIYGEDPPPPEPKKTPEQIKEMRRRNRRMTSLKLW